MTNPAIDRDKLNHATLWIVAVTVAALGTWIMYDAMPGINWGIWTTAAAAGLMVCVQSPHRMPVVVTATVAAIIAFGASVTADPFMVFLICVAVILFLALSMLLSTDPQFDRITARFTLPAPIVAFAVAVVEAIRRAGHALQVVKSNRARAVLQGIAISLPVIIIFALLLASADPVFANWRDAIQRILESWEFLPRTIFFVGLLTIVLGACGFAAGGEAPPDILRSAIVSQRRWLGSTERLILVSSVALLFWIFIVLQLSYLFGSSPRISGTGMTFAEYARRGFAELTVVASASVLLILFCAHFAERDEKRSILRAVTLALILGVLFLLGSAFHRVALYEQAYGFTTARLYAQAYMVVVAVAIISLAIEVHGEVNPSRLFRRTAVAATIAFIALIYWNHEAWIADRNIDRLATTGKLDIVYLTRDLSPNAVPTVVERLQTMPEPVRTQLRNALELRYRGRHRMLEGPWHEWNARRSAAARALRTAGVSLDYEAPSPAR